MNLLNIECHEDTLIGAMFDEETYSKPIFDVVRWKGTLISNEYGGFEGHVKNETQELFVFGYYVPNKGLILYEFGEDGSAINVMNLEKDLDCLSKENEEEILNPDQDLLRMYKSFNEGGYEVINHAYNDYCGSTEGYCRITLETIREMSLDEVKTNEEVRNIFNKILEQRSKMSNKHRRIYLNFSAKLQEFISNNNDPEYIKQLKDSQ